MTNPKQLNSDDLKRMSPEAIVRAQKEGQLSELMEGRDSAAAANRARVNRARALLRQLTPDEIAVATRDGKLDDLLAGRG